MSSKKNKRIIRGFGSPMKGSDGGDHFMNMCMSPPSLTFSITSRDVADLLPRSSSMLSEDSVVGCYARTPAIYIQEFTELCEIGRGAFGRVVKAKKRTDAMVYAIKISWTTIKGERDQEARSREVHALARCDHPHILRYFTSWIEDGHLYLQTEFCPGGSVSKKPASFWTQTTALQLLAQMASALNYLHGNNMAHMDVKGENIYINSQGAFKLGDFGLVAFLDDLRAARAELPRCFSQLSQESCASQEEGDRKYLSLEVLNDKSDLRAADVFALGISIYELCSGQELPGSGEEWQQLRRGQLGPLPQLSTEAYALITRMMAFNPKERPSAAEVETICHVLLRGGCQR